MEHPGILLSSAAFLALALLAGLVAALDPRRRAPAPPLSIGAGTFLAVVASFVVLAGLGLPPTVAQGAALALGSAATWADAA